LAILIEEENLNYSAGRRKQYAFDPEALDNHVYADRLGNKKEVDEEYLFSQVGLTKSGRELGDVGSQGT
jgi:predicted chitinase